MKPEKAIELGKEAVDSLRAHRFHDHADAVALGREALKFLIIIRQGSENKFPDLLPGETEE